MPMPINHLDACRLPLRVAEQGDCTTRRRALCAVVVLCGLVVAGLAARQEPSGARFSSQLQLVEVYATVVDASGAPVTGLRREDFQVFEDGQIQEISAFASGEFPLTVALGVDRSWSMAGERLTRAKQASQAFLRALAPSDRSMIVAIGSEAEVVAPLGRDRAGQIAAIARLDPWSTTALHDAVIATLDRLAPEPGRQALVVFSDGADRYSHASASEAVDRARRSQALIYPIGLGRERPSLLAELAVVTGGRSFLVRDVRDLDQTLVEIARELRYQYLLGYAPIAPLDPREPGWRSIRVTVRTSGVRVRARDGYFAD